MKGCVYMLFKGSGVAIITPFNKDKNINYDKMNELIEFHIANDTDAIIVCGTTGESSTLSNDEKKELIKFTVEKVNKRIPVIAGTGSNNTKIAIEISKYAEEVGVDGLLLVTPYYNKCSKEGLYLHFKEIAECVSIPIMLYNVPSRTCVNIEVDTLEKLSNIKNIVAIKEASSNISQITSIAAKLHDKIDIYSGNDDQTLAILSLGGVGVVSVAANVIPSEIHNLCQNFFDGNISKSKNIQFKYLDLMKNLFSDVNPIPIKEAMNILKFNVGKTRLPLSDMDKKNIAKLKTAISNAGIS